VVSEPYRDFRGDLFVNKRIRVRASVLELLPETGIQSAGLMAYSRSGRKANVYKAHYEQRDVAVKVFFRKFAIVENQLTARFFSGYGSVPGLRVCDRQVLSPQEALKIGEVGLSWAILMPWIEGEPWAAVLEEERALSPQVCVDLARRTVEILAGLERRQLVHADISSSNVVIANLSGRPKIELIDVEDMYHPSLAYDVPFPPDGSPGYGHPRNKGNGCRNPYGDRFAGAILLAEMLAWRDPRIRGMVHDVSLFADSELGRNNAKYRHVRTVLASYSEAVAALFDRAWHSPSLKACPSMSQWKSAVADLGAAPLTFDVTRFSSLLTPKPPPSGRSLTPRPQTTLISTMKCAECGRFVPNRSPSSHTPTCSHHPTKAPPPFDLAAFLERSKGRSAPAAGSPSSDINDFLKGYMLGAGNLPSPTGRAVPTYDDVTFRSILDAPRAGRPPSPTPGRCVSCGRGLITVGGKVKGHAWNCANGPLAWLFG